MISESIEIEHRDKMGWAVTENELKQTNLEIW